MLPLTGPTNAALRRHAAQECLALARLLAEEPVHAAVNRQLAALQGGQQPLLTAAQLRHACAYAAFKAAAEPFVMDTAMATARMGGIQPPLAVREFLAGASPLPRAQRAALLAAVQEAAKVAMQLEPHNLKSIMVAAAATSLLGKHQASWELFQRGFQLAQSSGSDCWMARFGVEMVQAATVLARATPRASRSSAEAAAAALPVAEAALRRCKRLLPHQWTMELDPSMAAARNGIQHMVDVDLDGLSRCSNCGVQAIGLRLCGRCKSKDAKYCSHLAA